VRVGKSRRGEGPSPGQNARTGKENQNDGSEENRKLPENKKKQLVEKLKRTRNTFPRNPIPTIWGTALKHQERSKGKGEGAKAMCTESRQGRKKRIGKEPKARGRAYR